MYIFKVTLARCFSFNELYVTAKYSVIFNDQS